MRVPVHGHAMAARRDAVIELVKEQPREGRLGRDAVRDEGAVARLPALDQTRVNRLVHLVRRAVPLPQMLFQRPGYDLAQIMVKCGSSALWQDVKHIRRLFVHVACHRKAPQQVTFRVKGQAGRHQLKHGHAKRPDVRGVARPVRLLEHFRRHVGRSPHGHGPVSHQRHHDLFCHRLVHPNRRTEVDQLVGGGLPVLRLAANNVGRLHVPVDQAFGVHHLERGQDAPRRLDALPVVDGLPAFRVIADLAALPTRRSARVDGMVHVLPVEKLQDEPAHVGPNLDCTCTHRKMHGVLAFFGHEKLVHARFALQPSDIFLVEGTLLRQSNLDGHMVRRPVLPCLDYTAEGAFPKHRFRHILFEIRRKCVR